MVISLEQNVKSYLGKFCFIVHLTTFFVYLFILQQNYFVCSLTYVIKNADHVIIIGADRKGTLINVYAKTDVGITYLYFEEVLKSRKNRVLRGKMFYKVNKSLTFDELVKIVTLNKKTDISRAKKAAGGHPGG